MTTLTCAVVGLGVGEQHARVLARTPGASLRWVFDLDAVRMARVIDDLGQGAAASSFEQILEDPEVDLVSIATYDDAHSGQVIRALRARKHVFCEKPLCRTSQELAAIREAWLTSGRELACNLVLRNAPLYLWLRKAIASGDLGRVYAFDGDYLYGRLQKITDGWRREVEDYSVMLGGGVHMVDLMLWLTGERPRAVTARGNRIATEDTHFRYDDFSAATFAFPSGLIGRITANFGCVHPHHHVVRVFGTKATFVYDDQGARLHSSRDPMVESVRLEHPSLPKSKGELIPEFISNILGLEGRRHDTEHEFAVVAACMAADGAARTGHPTPTD